VEECPQCGAKLHGMNYCLNCRFLKKEEKEDWLLKLGQYCGYFVFFVFITVCLVLAIRVPKAAVFFLVIAIFGSYFFPPIKNLKRYS
jgi:hypothetical protein